MATCLRAIDILRWPGVLAATELGAVKPDAAFFDAVAAQLGLPPHQLIMAGDDSELDVAAARGAGWSAVLIQ